MTEKEIEHLLAKLENDTVELKADLQGSRQQEEKKALLRSVTAFYNTKGGVIIFGIRDKTAELLGLADPQQVEHGFLQQLRANVEDLDISPEIEIADFHEKKIVIAHCPKGSRPPYFIKGYLKPFIRDGSSDVEATDEQIAQMYRDRSPDSQDRFIIENSAIEDIDIGGATDYLNKTGMYDVSGNEVEIALLNEGILGKKLMIRYHLLLLGFYYLANNRRNFYRMP